MHLNERHKIDFVTCSLLWSKATDFTLQMRCTFYMILCTTSHIKSCFLFCCSHDVLILTTLWGFRSEEESTFCWSPFCSAASFTTGKEKEYLKLHGNLTPVSEIGIKLDIIVIVYLFSDHPFCSWSSLGTPSWSAWWHRCPAQLNPLQYRGV